MGDASRFAESCQRLRVRHCRQRRTRQPAFPQRRSRHCRLRRPQGGPRGRTRAVSRKISLKIFGLIFKKLGFEKSSKDRY